jgi:hypothetical protein
MALLHSNGVKRHDTINIEQKQMCPIQLQSFLVFLHSEEMLLRQAVVIGIYFTWEIFSLLFQMTDYCRFDAKRK